MTLTFIGLVIDIAIVVGVASVLLGLLGLVGLLLGVGKRTHRGDS